MEKNGSYTGGNVLLDRLTQQERDELLPALTVIETETATLLRKRDEPIDFIYFPVDGAYSVVAELSGGHAYEVGAVGRDDVLGAEILLGARIATRSALCQVTGSVARIDAAACAGACDRSDVLRDGLLESLRRQWFISEQTVVCNGVHEVTERAARWILMTSDQVGRSQFVLRREYLSMMLGVPKADVEFPLKHLEVEGALMVSDETLTIVSRANLEQAACECYATQVRAAPFSALNGTSRTS